MSQLLNLDLNNIGHMIGGLVFCYAAAWFLCRRFFKVTAAGLGVVAGVLANLIWEVSVDVWRLWPSMADSAGFDPYDPFLRGFLGAFGMGLLFLILPKPKVKK